MVDLRMDEHNERAFIDIGMAFDVGVV
jgi:hypothetical protein